MKSRCCTRIDGSVFVAASTILFLALTVRTAAADTEGAQFYRGLNLNGPPVVIDGNAWEGSDSKSYRCSDNAFENQNVPLVPETDAERAKMIRSSRWGGNLVELIDIPAGKYTLFLYVWEDNDPETYSIAVNGRTLMERYNSGPGGHWEKLGPWPTTVKGDGRIVISSQGGAANFSGIELWKGEYDGLGGTISDEDLAFFEKRIRPLLADRCYECHSASAQEVQGDLLVDSRAALRRGGASGPTVVPGDVDKSLLIEAVRYSSDKLQMPPDAKLAASEIADLERWVKLGAPDPRSQPTKHLGKQVDVDKAREFWSLRPIADPPLPEVQATMWPRSASDCFVLAELEKHELSPAHDADKWTLLRRVTYDLTGLPPTPEQVEAFASNDSPDAFERVIDRLLASPRYGQRWGRHWLDVVRYADTAGDNSDFPIPQMHRYRDWVIDALNQDQPYDDFVRDQLAGDLRGGATDQERNSRIIATGYLANARRFGSRVDDYPQHLTIEDTIDNLGRTFLGLTINCARCHDHKFDPITNRDYYALYGIFHSTRYPWPGIELDPKQHGFVLLVAPERRAETEQAIASRDKEQVRLDGVVNQLQEALKNAKEGEKEGLQQQLKEAERRAKEHLDQPPVAETAYAVTEAEAREDVAVQLKGDPAHPGDVVPRRFLTVLGGYELPADANESGRRQLAEWIVAPDNPLTARVMINRLWQHHFGRGLVPTPNDFGKQGKPPTHPELLDFWATRFRNSGWSIKSMQRQLMLSSTYQQSSSRIPEAIARDPSNQWLAGFPRRRLDAESVRDALLAMGGNLDLSLAGAHPFPAQHTWHYTQHAPFKAVYESNHRSVYLMTQRIQRHPYLAIFDGADPSTSTAARMVSTTPLQALYLLNDPFVHEQAKRVAERITAHAADEEARIEYAYELLFARQPTTEECAASAAFLEQARSLLEQDGIEGPHRTAEAWRACVRALFRLNEFVYLD